MSKKEKFNFLDELSYVLLRGLKHLFKINFFKIIAPIIVMGAVFIFTFIYFDFHILLLKKALPTISNKGLIQFSNYSLIKLFFLFYGFFLFLFLIILGKYDPQEKLTEAFKKIGLKNADGEPPIFIKKNKLNSQRINYILNCNGLSVEEFKDKKSRIESIFKKRIESIEGRGFGFVKITFNEKAFPKKVCYKSISKEKVLPKESFYIGLSNKGVLTQKIEDLPHMLIAGATGSGKSVFFKQALLSLLKSSSHIQMYLIDLKGGLEFRDFSKLSNVKVVKTIGDAVSLLILVKQEMEERFSYLEKCKRNKVTPLIDKKDRIVIGIDEASVLYSGSRSSDDYDLILKARSLTEHIAKLSRAASIHLILATQKVTKETIDTRIQENISGRMCFKLNTLEGSMRALGNARACHLPSISGRGIWHLGSEFEEIQAPNLEPLDLEKELKSLTSKRRDNYQEMLGERVPKNGSFIKIKKRSSRVNNKSKEIKSKEVGLDSF